MKTKNIISILLVIVLSGCASGYSITYNTDPTGASVICNGTNHGYSPVTLNYAPDENNKRTGTMRTVSCTAIWSSGVRKHFSNTWNLNEFPNGVMQTLQRPTGEGYAQDADFALRVQQMRNQQKQLELQEEQLSIQRRQYYQELFKPDFSDSDSDSESKTKRIECETYKIGSVLHTDCTQR